MYDIIADKILKKGNESSSSQSNSKSGLVILGTGLDCSKLANSIVHSSRVRFKEIVFIISTNEQTKAKICQSSLIEDLTKNLTVRKRNAKYIKGGIFFVSEIIFYFDLLEKIFDAKDLKRLVILDKNNVDPNSPLSAAVTKLKMENPVNSLPHASNLLALPDNRGEQQCQAHHSPQERQKPDEKFLL